MTQDYTAAIAELSAAYQANRVANASITAEVKAKYKAMMDAEIRDRRFAADKEFADHLAAVKEKADMPLTVIQEYVLHTKAWNRWVYWRDLAGIPAERVTAGLEREERNKQYRWDRVEYKGEERDALVWLKDPKGKNADKPVHIVIDHDYLHIPDWISDELPYILSLWSNRDNLMKLALPVINERFKKED